MSAPEASARIRGYLRSAGLEVLVGREDEVARAIRDFLEALGEKVDVGDAGSLYEYPVPAPAPEAACAAGDELAPAPYDLGAILGGRSEQTTRRLALLERLVERAQETTAAEWIGIYQRRANRSGAEVLVKLAYVGRPSRAEFPLTAEFARGSTNSTVGLTGRATVIDDVARHVGAGGAFYVCDREVQSEACLPLLGEGGRVVGIVDAEAKSRAYFGAGRLAILAALALVAPAVLP